MTFWTLSGLKALATSESGGDPTVCNVSGHCGLYQYDTATWKDFAPKAGVDLGLYPTADRAPAGLQTAVALQTPITHWTCPGCNSQAAGFAATPGYTSVAASTFADGLADPGAGFRLSSSNAPTSAVGSGGLSIEMVDPATGSGALTGSTDAGGGGSVADLAQTAAGLIPGSGSGTVTVQAGNTVQKLVTNAENYVGNTVRDAGQAMFGWMPNFAVRFFLILGALVIAAVALWRLTETGGNLRQMLPVR